MAAHSSILAWRIPWTEEHSRLESGGRKESDRTERLTLEGLGKQRARTGMPGTLYKCNLIYSSQ